MMRGRMLRAFRFASRLNFKIEKSTYEAIKRNASTIRFVSKERIRDELSKMLLEPYFKDNLPLILESGIFRTMPDTLKALKILNMNYTNVDIIEFFSLASFIKKEPIIDEFIISRKEIKFIEQTLFYAKRFILRDVDASILLDLDLEALEVALKILDIIGQRYYTKKELLDLYDSLPIKSEKDLALTGSDIKKAMSIGDSPLVRIYIEKAIYGVLFHGIKNNKSALVKYLQEVKNEE